MANKQEPIGVDPSQNELFKDPSTANQLFAEKVAATPGLPQPQPPQPKPPNINQITQNAATKAYPGITDQPKPAPGPKPPLRPQPQSNWWQSLSQGAQNLGGQAKELAQQYLPENVINTLNIGKNPVPTSWSGSGQALDKGNYAGAFQSMPGWGKAGLIGGGGLLLMLLLSKLFGKQASYNPAQVKEAQHVLHNMTPAQRAKLSGEAMATKTAGLFYKDIEPEGIGMRSTEEDADGNEIASDMVALTERYREPRLLTRLWDNPGEMHENDYMRAFDDSFDAMDQNPDMLSDIEERNRFPVLASKALQTNHPKRYRNISPEAAIQLLLNSDPDAIEALGGDEEKAAACKSAPRHSYTTKEKRSRGKFARGNRFQGSQTKSAELPRTVEDIGPNHQSVTYDVTGTPLAPDMANVKHYLGRYLSKNPELVTALGHGAQLGTTTALGAGLGALMGADRGNTAEGLGRGIIRGGATGLGMSAGGVLGGLLGGEHGNMIGGGLGGLLGYLGSGSLLGEPSGSAKHEKPEEKQSPLLSQRALKSAMSPMSSMSEHALSTLMLPIENRADMALLNTGDQIAQKIEDVLTKKDKEKEKEKQMAAISKAAAFALTIANK
jgi:hypothetical protein